MKQYVSCRALVSPHGWVTPNSMLDRSFPGLTFSYRVLGFDPAVDGRVLVELTAPSADTLAVIVEALAAFGVHGPKSLSASKALAETIAGGTWTVTGDPAATTCADNEGISREVAP